MGSVLGSIFHMQHLFKVRIISMQGNRRRTVGGGRIIMNAITWYYSLLVNHAKRSQISAFHKLIHDPAYLS